MNENTLDTSTDSPVAHDSWVDRHGLFAFVSVALLLVLLAAYANHFDNGFHFDDSHVIVDNLAIRNLGNAPKFFTDPNTFTSYAPNAVYRPLLTLSFALDYWMAGGLKPQVFHRTQFCFLLLLGALLMLLFRRLFDLGERSPWNRYVALFAATLFCVHTANTETVNYIASRSSLLATLGVTGSMLAYVAWPRGRWTYLYLLPMVVGGLAKPLTVMFAPILLAFVLLFEEEAKADRPPSEEEADADATPDDEELVAHALPSAGGRPKVAMALRRTAPAFVVGGLLFVFLSRMNADTVQYGVIGRWDYLLSQPFAWLHYVRLFFLPLGLTADTDWKTVTDWYDTRVVAGVVCILALAVGTVRLSLVPRLRPAAFGLAWFCLALLPTSSLVPLSEIYNEHRIFFPYVGLTLSVVWLAFLGLRRFFESRPDVSRTAALVVAMLVSGVLLALAVGTHVRNRTWKDEESLWADVVQKSPMNGRGLMNYGLALMRKNEYQQALDLFNRATVYNPNYAHLEINLGVVKGALGRDSEAEAHFLRALRLAPNYAGSYSYYARWLTEHGRAHEAVRNLETAIGISPTEAGPRTQLLRLYVAAGYEDKMRKLAADTLALVPDETTARAYLDDRLPLAVSGNTPEDYRMAGRRKIDEKAWLDAAGILRHALRLDDSSAVAWNNLGWARLMLGFSDLAAPCFSRAFKLDPTMRVARANLLEAQRQSRTLRR